MKTHFKIINRNKTVDVILGKRKVTVTNGPYVRDLIYVAKKFLLVETGLTEDQAIEAINTEQEEK